MESRERGFAFLPFLLGNWQIIAAVAGAIAVYTWYQHCEYVKRDRDQIIASLKSAAAENERRIKVIVAQAKKDKERADNENKVNRGRITSLSNQLRDARSASSYLPPAPAGSPSPATIAFDRAALDAAIRRLDAGIQGLIDEGDAAIADLDTAKRWAQ